MTPDEFRANLSASDATGDDPAPRAYRKDELHDSPTAPSPGSELIGSFAGRAVPYTRRIAAVYALADPSATISPRHLKSA
ncbi:hypothetical protein ACQEU6_44965 [Spirillospora sp. CA-108201]